MNSNPLRPDSLEKAPPEVVEYVRNLEGRIAELEQKLGVPRTRTFRADAAGDYDDELGRDGGGGPILGIIWFRDFSAKVCYFSGMISLVPVAGLLFGPVAVVFFMFAIITAYKNNSTLGLWEAFRGVAGGMIGGGYNTLMFLHLTKLI